MQLLICNKLIFTYVKAELVSQFSKFHVSLWTEVLYPFHPTQASIFLYCKSFSYVVIAES